MIPKQLNGNETTSHISRITLHNSQNPNETLLLPISILAKSLGKRDNFGAHCNN